MRVRVNLFPAMTKKFVSQTTKVKASNVTVTVATLGNLAVSTAEFKAAFKNFICQKDNNDIFADPKSCYRWLEEGFTSSGVYTINPDGGKPIQVLCDMNTDGGGWTVFQRRLNGSVDFYLGWESYKNGFGDLNGEFWLGNDNLHRLTAADDVTLRVDLEDFNGDIRYAEYMTFKVGDEIDEYRLLIGEYRGTAGDSMAAGHSLR